MSLYSPLLMTWKFSILKIALGNKGVEFDKTISIPNDNRPIHYELRTITALVSISESDSNRIESRYSTINISVQLYY
ncbi:hypothetical protein BB561_003548 [Smittium simulii]|uniref:Uncharacterized protein n=1 Tax=Smittium simulii TaxID=133385 RepID=A0A2T9YKP3_9FUNG|nr:hypothetical protein BB561_003548 [Smittium simulii]